MYVSEAAAKSIPIDQLGAEAQKQYTGDGVGITPTAGGARLRAAFQDLAAEATPDGLWLESTSDEDAGKPARFRVRAVAIGREGCSPIRLTDQGQVRATGEAALYLRPGLVEEYTVSMDGVRQDFVLPQRPAGTGELRVELAVDGARAEAATYGVKLTIDGSGRVIAYSRLHVADANGRELSARLEVAGAGRIQIRVDDSNASYPLRIDPTFSDADWTGFGRLPGPSGKVRAVAVDGSGNLYIAGEFTSVGEVPAAGIAKWNGSAWSALGSGIDGSVFALAVSGTDLYAGGYFTTAGGGSAAYIAKWNGSAWSALGSGMNAFGSVRALAVSGTDLYAGGDFITAGGIGANNIARWNGSTWSALGAGMAGASEMGGMVLALATSGADLYAGGYFTTAGSKLSAYIAQATKPFGPEIDIEQPASVPLADGSNNIEFGPAPVAGSSPAKTFTVMSTGTSDLTVSAVTPSGANAGDFTVNTTGMATTVTPGDSATFFTTFVVTFTPTGPGERSTTLQIFSTDADESPFDIALTGNGLSFTADGDGDGLNDASEFQLAALGFNWELPQSELVNTYYNSANGAGLYTTSQVQALHIDTPLIQRDGAGLFTLTLGLQKSATLLPGSFQPFRFTDGVMMINAEGKIEFQFASPDNAAFFRLRSQ